MPMTACLQMNMFMLQVLAINHPYIMGKADMG